MRALAQRVVDPRLQAGRGAEFSADARASPCHGYMLISLAIIAQILHMSLSLPVPGCSGRRSNRRMLNAWTPVKNFIFQ